MPNFSTFREHSQFQEWARRLVRLPEPGEGPLDYLLPEARWQELLDREPDPAAWLMALSQATGVYFFPSREWPLRLLRYLQLLKITRLLEAGAGRGYLTAALAPLCEAAGLAFRAVDKGEGEFQSGLRSHPRVERGDVFTASPGFSARGGALCLAAAGTIVGRDLPGGFSALSYSGGRGRRRGHRRSAGLANPAAPGIGGLEPLRPGPHRTGAAPGDGL